MADTSVSLLERLRVLDGNHLTGTEHRLKGLRGTRAAALPGQALVLYDPRYDLITDTIPCEDAYTKHKRGPKKKPPKKTSGKRFHHVSTARILAGRT